MILTREPEDNRPLLDRLRAEGIEASECPCLATRYRPREAWRVEPGGRAGVPDGSPVMPDGMPAVAGGMPPKRAAMPVGPGGPPEEYAAWAFTSRRAVRALARAGAAVPASVRTIAAVGSGTARALETRLGRAPEVVADPPTGEGLARALAPRLRPGEAVLHVRGDRTTGSLRRALESGGFRAADLVVYETVAPAIVPFEPRRPALVVLASPSAARHFLAARPLAARSDRYVAVGPTTAAWLRERLGASAEIRVAGSPGVEGLLGAIRGALGQERLDEDPGAQG